MPPVRELFALHGLRCTRQREAVYTALRGTKKHPTPEQLHTLVKQTDAAISLATVYNTLDALCDAGLCRRFATESGASGASVYRYDADIEDHAHLETADGRLLDLPQALDDELQDAIPAELLRRIEYATGVKIDRVTLRLIESDEKRAS
ncbi:MAG: hypothetical protein Tsb0013_08910 [Phycisphaerales bacterium]